MLKSPTFIDAQTANVGDTVTFHARGATRTGTVLAVKGVRAEVEFFVQPTKWDATGRRVQWIRFNVAEKGDAQSNAVKKAKAALTRVRNQQARSAARWAQTLAEATPEAFALDQAEARALAERGRWDFTPWVLTVGFAEWQASIQQNADREARWHAERVAAAEAALAALQS